jgi:hypothetical protein
MHRESRVLLEKVPDAFTPQVRAFYKSIAFLQEFFALFVKISRLHSPYPQFRELCVVSTSR